MSMSREGFLRMASKLFNGLEPVYRHTEKSCNYSIALQRFSTNIKIKIIIKLISVLLARAYVPLGQIKLVLIL